jgi:hypothetical protein
MSFHPRTPSRRLWWSFTLLTGFSILGCGTADTAEETPPDYTNVVPVTGTVKANGKPLATAVVTFLPPKWSASNGETGEKGAFSLQTAGQPGVPPGEYKVCISYLVSADGEPQGLGPRSAIVPPPGMTTAKEKIPAEFSDFGRTTLTRTVPANGGNFDFDIPINLDIAEPAKAEPAKAESEPEPAKAEPAKAESEPEPAKAEPAKAEPK